MGDMSHEEGVTLSIPESGTQTIDLLQKAQTKLEQVTQELEDFRSAVQLNDSTHEDELSGLKQQYESQINSLQTILAENVEEYQRLAKEKTMWHEERQRFVEELKQQQQTNSASSANTLNDDRNGKHDREERVLRSMWQRATRQYLDWREEHVRLLLQVIGLLTPEQVEALRCVLQSRNHTAKRFSPQGGNGVQRQIPRSSTVSTGAPGQEAGLFMDKMITASPTYQRRLQRLLGLERMPRRDSALSLDAGLSPHCTPHRGTSPSKSVSGGVRQHGSQISTTSSSSSGLPTTSRRQKLLRLKLYRSLSEEQLCTCGWHHVEMHTTQQQVEDDTAHDSMIDSDTSEINSLNLTEEDLMALFDLPPTAVTTSVPPLPPRSATSTPQPQVASKMQTSFPVPPTGHRLVSEREWTRMQLEVQDLKQQLRHAMQWTSSEHRDSKEMSSKRGSTRCEMCRNYEDQLQSLQEHFQDVNKQLQVTQAQLVEARQRCSTLTEVQGDLENRLKTRCSAQAEKIRSLEQSVETLWERLQSCHHQWTQATLRMREVLQQMETQRRQTSREYENMKTQYTELMHAHESVKSQELLAADIQLPQSVDELTHYALGIREKLIDFMAAKEHLEQRLNTETVLLQDQVAQLREQLQTTQESLTRTANELQQKSVEWDASRTELDGRLTYCRQHHANADKLAQENAEYRKKYQSLQMDLENAESVQRDFVQLSQRLQMQLEQFRQQESSEVRWQHEEDVAACNECGGNFANSTSSVSMFSVGAGGVKKKLHCRHCGRIFCGDCLNKTVYSGPGKRPARVCSVCHTMLVKDAVPYFSLQNPNTVAQQQDSFHRRISSSATGPTQSNS